MKAKAFVFHLLVVGFVAGCSRSDPPPAAPPSAAPGTGIVGSAATPQPVAAAPEAATPAGAATGPAAAPAGAPAIANADGETPGIRLAVTEFKRASGGTVNLKMTMFNDGDKPHSFSYDYGDGSLGATDFNAIGGVHLIDPVGKKKYFVARDSENKCVCSRGLSAIPPQGRVNVWAKFPAPPEDVAAVSIVVPHFPPLDDVPLGR